MFFLLIFNYLNFVTFNLVLYYSIAYFTYLGAVHKLCQQNRAAVRGEVSKVPVIFRGPPVLQYLTIMIFFWFLFHYQIDITCGHVATLPTFFIGNFCRRPYSQVMLKKHVQQYRQRDHGPNKFTPVY